MKILIIDDEILVAKSFERIFAKKHQTMVAYDGNSGLKKWIEFNPDIVILDFIMPGLNADQLIQKKPKDSHAKICLISAYIGDSETETQILKKVDLFISKPFEDIVFVSKKVLEMVGV